MFRGPPPHTHTLPPQPSAEKPRTTSIHFPGTRPHQQALFPGQTGGRNLRTSRSRQVAFCGARAASAAWRRLGTRPSVRGRPRRAWRRRGLGGAADPKQGTRKAALWEGWWGGVGSEEVGQKALFQKVRQERGVGHQVPRNRGGAAWKPGSLLPTDVATASSHPEGPSHPEVVRDDPDGRIGQWRDRWPLRLPCRCVNDRDTQGDPYQHRTGQRYLLPPPPPPYKCKLVSVLGKKANKSLINVCCVVDDFVTTSVANGLCMRNNGLLAEREIA